MRTLSGFSADEMEGENYEQSIVHPDDRARVATHMRSFATVPNPPRRLWLRWSPYGFAGSTKRATGCFLR
jgi:hypothetical protein